MDLKEAASRKFSGPVPYFLNSGYPAPKEPRLSYQVGLIAVRQLLSGDQKKAVTSHFSSLHLFADRLKVGQLLRGVLVCVQRTFQLHENEVN